MNLSWLYNILLTSFISTIVTIMIDHYLLSNYTSNKCDKLYKYFVEGGKSKDLKANV